MNFKRFHESKNLFDEVYPDIIYDIPRYKSVYVGNGTFTLSTNTPMYGQSAVLFLLAGNVSSGASTPNNGVSVGISRTVTAIDGYVTIAYRGYTSINPRNYQTMLNTGSQPLPYEPYSSEVWHDTPHYIHNTSTDIITTLPANLYADGNNATVGLKGNMVQTSQPSPTSPVMPQGTGERTGNLYFKKLAGANISDGGVIATITGFDLYIAEVEQGVQYSGNGYIYAFFKDVPAIGSISFNNSRAVESFKNIVSPINGFVAVRNPNTIQNAMCNTGNTILPYEPYGYKLDISSANTTTPVYLGEVETTRKIKKLVLTGREIYTADASYSRFITTFPNVKIEGLRLTQVYCTHFISVYDGRPISEVPNNSIYSSDVSVDRFFIKTTDYTTSADFQSYLAAQYAAGTPVTVWYVLAEPETGIVNEPLRKIGDYADEVSGITIPTIAGANTITVDTTLQPSEVSVNYKGWHPVQSVHEAENGQWD